MGKLSLRYFGPVVWETLLTEKYKIIDNLAKFENDIKDWTVNVCYVRPNLLQRVSLEHQSNVLSSDSGFCVF